MDKVRIGVVGLGNIGKLHTGYLRAGKVDRAALTAVCDGIPERLSPFGKLKTFARSEDLIRSGEVDAVIIGTPHYFHTSIGIDALAQGLHVLVEKPISVHKADAERLIAAHTNEQQVFAAMFNQRTDPSYRKIRQLVQRGELGDIQRMSWIITDWFRTAAYYRSSDWRATWRGEGGGVLINQSPHWVDVFMLLGGLPCKVTAQTRARMHKIEVEDEAAAVLEYPGGAWGYYYTTTCEPQGDDVIQIIGDKGKLYLSGREGLKAYTYTSPLSKYTTAATGMWDKLEVKEFKVKRPRATTLGHTGVHRDFLRAVAAGTPRITPGEEGIWTVEFINAIIMSGKTGKPVKVPVSRRGYDQLMGKLKKLTKPKKVVKSRPQVDPNLAEREKVGK